MSDAGSIRWPVMRREQPLTLIALRPGESRRLCLPGEKVHRLL